jgi:hypothetical protein
VLASPRVRPPQPSSAPLAPAGPPSPPSPRLYWLRLGSSVVVHALPHLCMPVHHRSFVSAPSRSCTCLFSLFSRGRVSWCCWPSFCCPFAPHLSPTLVHVHPTRPPLFAPLPPPARFCHACPRLYPSPHPCLAFMWPLIALIRAFVLANLVWPSFALIRTCSFDFRLGSSVLVCALLGLVELSACSSASYLSLYQKQS